MTTAVAPIAAIDRKAALRYADFERDYLFPLKPVVLVGALNNWPAVGKWTPEFFRTTFADRELNVDGKILCRDFIDHVEASNEKNKAPYLHAQHLQHVFPELTADIEPTPIFLGPNWLSRKVYPGTLHRRLLDHTSAEIYIGGKDAGFPFLHYDDYHYHAYIGQVYGLKKFFVYSPDQTEYVYPTPRRKHVARVRDVEHPDLEKYPLFAQAKPQTCVLEPGDLLFMPCGWWHTTRMLSTSISIALNAVNASNWRHVQADFIEEMAEFHSPLKLWLYTAYLKWHGAKQKFKDRWRG
jgi:histone arginine demethylase JMJD6